MKIISEIKTTFLQVLGNFITFAAAIFVIIEADTIDPSQGFDYYLCPECNPSSELAC